MRKRRKLSCDVLQTLLAKARVSDEAMHEIVTETLKSAGLDDDTVSLTTWKKWFKQSYQTSA